MIVMQRAQFVVGEHTVGLNIPIQKNNIDVERRIVSGWATLDNLDQTGDIVTAEASLEAFKTFRGNVREMHDKSSAVGKVVNFSQKEYIGEDGRPYTGIYVDVYVSKGAQDTWEKVLDGTLSAFSIYGPIAEDAIVKQYMPDDDRMARIINKYSLIELSLVDNPGNELCNVMSVQKVNKGIAADVVVENVFWCEKDRIAFHTSDVVQKCYACSGDMEDLGWFEPDGSSDQDSITKILQANNKLEKNLDVAKGGSEMSDEQKQEVQEEEVKPVEETATDKAPEVKAEEEVSEEVTPVNEPDLAGIAKALEDIKGALAKANEDASAREGALDAVRTSVETVEKSINDRLEEMHGKYTELEKEVKSFKEGLGDVEKRLGVLGETVEKSSAGKKSSDVESELLKKSNDSKSLWSGSFLPTSYDQE